MRVKLMFADVLLIFHTSLSKVCCRSLPCKGTDAVDDDVFPPGSRAASNGGRPQGGAAETVNVHRHTAQIRNGGRNAQGPPEKVPGKRWCTSVIQTDKCICGSGGVTGVKQNVSNTCLDLFTGIRFKQPTLFSGKNHQQFAVPSFLLAQL